MSRAESLPADLVVESPASSSGGEVYDPSAGSGDAAGAPVVGGRGVSRRRQGSGTRNPASPGWLVQNISTLGRAVRMAFSALAIGLDDLVHLRVQWRESLAQAWFLVSVTAVPGVLMAIPFGVIVSAQVGNLVYQLGASSLIGAAGGMGVIRQGAPVATGLLLGGAGAAAIAADLGARTIREEVDAMRVMGVNPIQRLVVPRIVAMVFIAPLLNTLIIAVGVGAGFLVAVVALDVSAGSYWMSFGAFATGIDVWVSLLKSVIFGFLVVVISCQRGLEAKGGSRGVADGVNAAVVLSVVSIVVVNTGITQVVSMFAPMRFG